MLRRGYWRCIRIMVMHTRRDFLEFGKVTRGNGTSAWPKVDCTRGLCARRDSSWDDMVSGGISRERWNVGGNRLVANGKNGTPGQQRIRLERLQRRSRAELGSIAVQFGGFTGAIKTPR